MSHTTFGICGKGGRGGGRVKVIHNQHILLVAVEGH